MAEVLEKRQDERFRILVCIDGSDEGYRGLRYAAKLAGKEKDADIVLVYVRPVDQGLRSGGLQVSVARENMLQWGLELPGIKYLKKGLDILLELGVLTDEWEQKHFHMDVEGTSLGDNKIDYVAKNGRKVVLKLKVAPDIVTGILDQWELGEYDVIILGASERWRERKTKNFTDPKVAEKVAKNAPCTVIVSRGIEVGHGHLVCVDNSRYAMEAIRQEAHLATRCGCPVALVSVARNEKERPKVEALLDEAEVVMKEEGITPAEKIVKVGDALEQIIEIGPDYSLIVVADPGKSPLTEFFRGSVAFDVVTKAYNSVMMVR